MTDPKIERLTSAIRPPETLAEMRRSRRWAIDKCNRAAASALENGYESDAAKITSHAINLELIRTVFLGGRSRW